MEPRDSARAKLPWQVVSFRPFGVVQGFCCIQRSRKMMSQKVDILVIFPESKYLGTCGSQSTVQSLVANFHVKLVFCSSSTWWLWDLFLCGQHSTISTDPSCVWQPKLAESTGSCFLAKSIGLKVSTISFKEVSIKESCPQRSKDLQKMSVFSTWLIKIRPIVSLNNPFFVTRWNDALHGARKEWDHWIEHRRGKTKGFPP